MKKGPKFYGVGGCGTNAPLGHARAKIGVIDNLTGHHINDIGYV